MIDGNACRGSLVNEDTRTFTAFYFGDLFGDFCEFSVKREL
jgi:hypothetical protein